MALSRLLGKTRPGADEPRCHVLARRGLSQHFPGHEERMRAHEARVAAELARQGGKWQDEIDAAEGEAA